MLSGGQLRNAESIIKSSVFNTPSGDAKSLRATYSLLDGFSYSQLELFLEAARVLVAGDAVNFFQFGNVVTVVATFNCDETLMQKNLQYDPQCKAIGGLQSGVITQEMLKTREQREKMSNEISSGRQILQDKVMVYGVEIE